MRVELYQSPGDYVRLVLEVILTIWVAIQILSEFWAIIQAKRQQVCGAPSLPCPSQPAWCFCICTLQTLTCLLTRCAYSPKQGLYFSDRCHASTVFNSICSCRAGCQGACLPSHNLHSRSLWHLLSKLRLSCALGFESLMIPDTTDPGSTKLPASCAVPAGVLFRLLQVGLEHCGLLIYRPALCLCYCLVGLCSAGRPAL